MFISEWNNSQCSLGSWAPEILIRVLKGRGKVRIGGVICSEEHTLILVESNDGRLFI